MSSKYSQNFWCLSVHVFDLCFTTFLFPCICCITEVMLIEYCRLLNQVSISYWSLTCSLLRTMFFNLRRTLSKRYILLNCIWLTARASCGRCIHRCSIELKKLYRKIFCNLHTMIRLFSFSRIISICLIFRAVKYTKKRLILVRTSHTSRGNNSLSPTCIIFAWIYDNHDSSYRTFFTCSCPHNKLFSKYNHPII